MISVTTLSLRDEGAYTQFVGSHPDALVSYTLRYRDLLSAVLGCTPRYAIALQDDQIVGLLPLMELDGPYGRVLNSLPYFGSNGGPLVSSPVAATELSSWYQCQVGDDMTAAATLITNPFPGPEVSVDHDFTDVRIGHVTDLPASGDEADLLHLIDGSARRNIRKAERLGIRVAIENDAIDSLQAMHAESMNAIGADVKSAAFFRALQQHFRAGQDYEIFLARLDESPVAALLVFYTGITVDYFIPATRPDFRAAQPLALILRTAMLHAAKRGAQRWNWGGSPTSHIPLQRFKAKWGGVPLEYRYLTKVNTPTVLSATPNDLRSGYPGFFVVPYDKLCGGAERELTA